MRVTKKTEQSLCVAHPLPKARADDAYHEGLLLTGAVALIPQAAR